MAVLAEREGGGLELPVQVLPVRKAYKSPKALFLPPEKRLWQDPRLLKAYNFQTMNRDVVSTRGA